MIPVRTVVVLSALIGLAACDGAGESSARAQPQAQGTRYADQDRDGRVTRKEASADPYLSASFDRYDADKNDELDRAEFARLEARASERRETAPQDARYVSRPRNEYPHPSD